MRNSDHQVEQLAERYRELIVAAAAHNDAAAHVTTQMELTKDQLAELAPDHPLLEPDAVSSVLGDLQVHPLGALLEIFFRPQNQNGRGTGFDLVLLGASVALRGADAGETQRILKQLLPQIYRQLEPQHAIVR